MLGQLIYEEKLPKSSNQTILDTRAYKKGLYKVVVGESIGHSWLRIKNNPKGRVYRH